MERIQSAIQKARAARAQDATHDVRRDQKPAGTPKPAPLAAAPDPADLSASDRLWAALPEAEINSSALQKARVFVSQSGDLATPFDVLRTRMLHQMRTNNWRRVAVTSPGSGCGKTTLSLNLAFSLARQRDAHTMVIDLDMRRPSMGKLLQTSQERAFARALEGQSSPEEHLICFKERLAFGTNRNPTDNSAELLQSQSAAHVIDRLEERYQPDVMLFDTPPMLACDDTFAFLDQIDCVLLVAAAEKTTAEELEKCEREIGSRSNLLGVVLNKCRLLDRADSYGY